MNAKGYNQFDEENPSAFEDFLSEYGGIGFDKVTFRKSAWFVGGFGPDYNFQTFRIHPAIDRGTHGKTSPIYCPFNATHIELNDRAQKVWGYQLRIHTSYGFEIRVAHIKHLSEDLLKIIENKSPIISGTYLANASSVGMSTGIHTHTEVVSYDEQSSFLEEILFRKYGVDYKKEITLQDIAQSMIENKIDEDAETVMKEQYTKRRISALTPHLCRRKDYFDRKPVTFYNSRSCFGM